MKGLFQCPPELGVFALYLSIRPVTVGSGREERTEGQLKGNWSGLKGNWRATGADLRKYN